MESNAMSLPERVRTALSSPDVEAEFRKLAAASASIVEITNPAGYDECHAARMRLVKARTSTVARGKAVREDAQAFAKAVIAEEKRLIGIIEPEEERLQALQKAEDDKREAKIRAERERVEHIQQGIAQFGLDAAEMAGCSSEKIAREIDLMSKVEVEKWAMEFIPEANSAKIKALEMLKSWHAGALAHEKERAEQEAKLKAEAEELARLRAEQAKRDAEAAERAAAEAKAQAEARAKIEAEEKAARERREADDRAAQAERDRQDAIARSAREAEQKRLDEEAAKVRAEREAVEAREREARRLEAELMDGQQMLAVFKDRFGKRREFSGVVKAIDAYFAAKAERVAA